MFENSALCLLLAHYLAYMLSYSGSKFKTEDDIIIVNLIEQHICYMHVLTGSIYSVAYTCIIVMVLVMQTTYLMNQLQVLLKPMAWHDGDNPWPQPVANGHLNLN